MHGIFIHLNRPKSKKAVREALKDENVRNWVILEATSLFGNEYDGPVVDAPAGKYYFVGPDPYNKRNFYGSITVKPDGSITVA